MFLIVFKINNKKFKKKIIAQQHIKTGISIKKKKIIKAAGSKINIKDAFV